MFSPHFFGKKVKKGKVVARVAAHEFSKRELDELNLEANLLKKEKRGKLRGKEFDKRLREEVEKIDEEELQVALHQDKKRQRRKKKREKKAEANKVIE